MLGRFSVKSFGFIVFGECLVSILSFEGVRDWFLDDPELVFVEDPELLFFL